MAKPIKRPVVSEKADLYASIAKLTNRVNELVTDVANSRAQIKRMDDYLRNRPPPQSDCTSSSIRHPKDYLTRS